mmetsp:Transcript_11521/g.30071  ORF Transcript_11521/g.30071 Transcript_11521/m.30071 type:complete len:226 (-) Transcript_11521:60-737(-)
MTHFLNSRFAFFYLRRDRSQKETDAQGYQNAVQKIGSFDSVEGFFGIYDHLVKPHSLTSESHVTDYHLFREGISPTWEDPKNRNGGKWIVRLRKVEGLASLYWEDLIMALVGEQFGDVGVQVCGVVVSVRQHEDILSVWTQDSKDDDAIAKIRDAIKTNLELPPFVTIDYKRHAFHGGQGRAWGGRKQQGDRPHHRRQDRGPRQHHREEAPPPPAERDWGALRRK